MSSSPWRRFWTLCFSSALVASCSDAENASNGSSSGSGGSDSGSCGTVGGTGGEPGTAGTTTATGTGGVAGAAGTGNGGNSGAGGAAGGGSVTDGGAVVGATKCASAPNTTLPSDAPALMPAVWKDISPSMVTFGNNVFTQGLAVDPCNTATLYLTVSAFEASLGGLFKSTNAGTSWTKIGKVVPNFTGIGGANFDMPATFSKFNFLDVYDVAADPTDFNHVLVSFHSTYSSAVLESKDGGDTWIPHTVPGVGAGNSINFLYAPDLGVGDNQTWLLGTQGAAQWRTSDGGQTWTKVTDNGIQHGGGTIYYTKAGVLYASGNPHNLRSTDNGKTWATINDSNGYTAIFGDGTNLYTEKIFGPAPFITSLETDGTKWTDFGAQQFVQGPFEMGIDPVNHILYTASWNAGMWAIKLK